MLFMFCSFLLLSSKYSITHPHFNILPRLSHPLHYPGPILDNRISGGLAQNFPPAMVSSRGPYSLLTLKDSNVFLQKGPFLHGFEGASPPQPSRPSAVSGPSLLILSGGLCTVMKYDQGPKQNSIYTFSKMPSANVSPRFSL